MKKYELKQIIREVLTEANRETLQQAGYTYLKPLDAKHVGGLHLVGDE